MFTCITLYTLSFIFIKQKTPPKGGALCRGGTIWIRTKDLFDVNEAL